ARAGAGGIPPADGGPQGLAAVRARGRRGRRAVSRDLLLPGAAVPRRARTRRAHRPFRALTGCVGQGVGDNFERRACPVVACLGQAVLPSACGGRVTFLFWPKEKSPKEMAWKVQTTLACPPASGFFDRTSLSCRKTAVVLSAALRVCGLCGDLSLP